MEPFSGGLGGLQQHVEGEVNLFPQLKVGNLYLEGKFAKTFSVVEMRDDNLGGGFKYYFHPYLGK